MKKFTRYNNENSFFGLVAFISCLLFFGLKAKVNAQTRPDFGAASSFVLFSGAGAVSNTGAISGFGAPTTIDGTIENVNAITVQAALDLKAACVQLQNTAPTITNHITIYGNGETLVPGVYSAGAAVSILGTLELDAQGDPNAIFISKVGGALTTAAGVTVTLVNGASASNVFWIANGAIAMAAGTTMVGKVIGYDGAVSMGAGCVLDGSLYANAGAVSIYGTVAAVPAVPILTPTVISQSTTNTSPTISGTWGGSILGDDTLTVTVNGITYSEEIYINNESWSFTIYYPELLPGVYDVVATTTRTSNNKTSTDTSTSELVILLSVDTTTVTSANNGGLESNGDLA